MDWRLLERVRGCVLVDEPANDLAMPLTTMLRIGDDECRFDINNSIDEALMAFSSMALGDDRVRACVLSSDVCFLTHRSCAHVERVHNVTVVIDSHAYH